MSDRLKKPEPSRREFLNAAGLVTSGLAVAGSLVGVLRLPKPNVSPEPSLRVKIGAGEAFPPGTVQIFPEHRFRVVSTDQGLAAMSLVCTHLGCIVAETPEGFSCPCHGSRFTQSGAVTGGPAPRPLPWLEMSLAADGSLVVDLSREVPPDTWFTA